MLDPELEPECITVPVLLRQKFVIPAVQVSVPAPGPICVFKD